MSKITIALEGAVAAVVASTPAEGTRPTARQRADADRAFAQILKLIAPRIRRFIRQYGLVAHWEDAEQACAIGVHRAIQGYEPEKAQFTTFVNWQLRGGVRSFVSDAGSEEPAAADGGEATELSGRRAAVADTPRDSMSAPVTPSAIFGDRLAGAERGDAPPPSATGPIGGAAAQPSAPRTVDAPAAPPPPAHEPTVAARAGQIGREMGVEIARRLSAGGEELTVRLNPVEMGRIEVRLSFDERGTLRAAVSAESAAALEMLRRDSADLGRALSDAGVRADAGSFRFDSRSGGGEGGQFWQRQQATNGRGRATDTGGADDPADLGPIYRPLRASGRVDLVA